MADEIYKLLIFLKRKPGLSTEDFRSYYEEKHLTVIMPYMAGPVSYRRYYLDPVESQSEQEFDVVTELCFADKMMRDMVLAGVASDQLPAEVIEDEKNFIDRPKSRVYAVTERETRLETTQS